MFTEEKAGRHQLDKKRRPNISSNRTYQHNTCPGRMHIDKSLLRSYPKFITSIQWWENIRNTQIEQQYINNRPVVFQSVSHERQGKTKAPSQEILQVNAMLDPGLGLEAEKGH